MSDSKTKFSMLASLSQALASATEAPGQGLSHLARARQVAGSMPVQNGSTENAEFEGAEWWEEHAELFAAARAEWGVLHPELFDLEASAESFIDPRLLRAVSALERAAASFGAVLRAATASGSQKRVNRGSVLPNICATVRLPAKARRPPPR